MNDRTTSPDPNCKHHWVMLRYEGTSNGHTSIETYFCDKCLAKATISDETQCDRRVFVKEVERFKTATRFD